MTTSQGRFIVFEGLDGAGTTTQAERLKNWFETTQGRRVYLTREPTQGPVGGLLQLALRKRLTLDPYTMALLFAADRMDHLAGDITAKLKSGVTVICDRYYLSSFAYELLDQHTGLAWLETLNEKAIPPDLTLLIDVPAEVCMARIKKTRWHVELFEKQEKLEVVRQNYLDLVERRRAFERIVVINGNQDRDAVCQDVVHAVRQFFNLEVP